MNKTTSKIQELYRRKTLTIATAALLGSSPALGQTATQQSQDADFIKTSVKIQQTDLTSTRLNIVFNEFQQQECFKDLKQYMAKNNLSNNDTFTYNGPNGSTYQQYEGNFGLDAKKGFCREWSTPTGDIQTIKFENGNSLVTLFSEECNLTATFDKNGNAIEYYDHKGDKLNLNENEPLSQIGYFARANNLPSGNKKSNTINWQAAQKIAQHVK